jgi:hypothetical protein
VSVYQYLSARGKGQEAPRHAKELVGQELLRAEDKVGKGRKKAAKRRFWGDVKVSHPLKSTTYES